MRHLARNLRRPREGARPIGVALLVGILILAVSSPALALDGPYTLRWFTMEGGGSSGGGGYTLRGAIGQPDAGESEGGGYTLRGGFWAATRVMTAPSDVTISIVGSDLRLDWSDVGADSYEVWHGEDAYLQPAGDCGTAANCTVETSNSHVHAGAAADGTDHYYVVRAVRAGYITSGNSNRVGAFAFPLEPGS